jgi:bla regulator protein BlaR1
VNAIQFLEALISVSLQSAFVIIAAEWLSLQTSIRQRSQLWTACYVILLLLAGSAAALPHLRWLPPIPWEQSDVVPLVDFEQHLGGWLCLIWAMGAGVAIAVVIARMVLTFRFLKGCHPVDAAGLPVAEEVLGRSVQWLSSPKLQGPFCWQFHRPVVVLPEYMLALEPRELAMVLRHELEHLRTQHPLQLFLQHVVETLLWFHPLIWRAARQATLARELACDEAAIESPQDVVCYLRILLRIVERHAAAPTPGGAALGMARERGLLIDRAHRLVELAQSGGGQDRATRLAIPLLAVVSLATAALWLPINGLASPRAAWSPWPGWSARALHGVGLHVRDFEVYDRRLELHDLRRAAVNRDSR